MGLEERQSCGRILLANLSSGSGIELSFWGESFVGGGGVVTRGPMSPDLSEHFVTKLDSDTNIGSQEKTCATPATPASPTNMAASSLRPSP